MAEAEGALCGYVLVLFRTTNRAARIYSIAVNPQMRGQKIGFRLLRAAEAEAGRRTLRMISLEVREDNTAARTLYHQCGYEFVVRLPDYYEDGSSALRLRKCLNGSHSH
jgi:ribosomal protein S18 acetylase RimI-like enzyme